MTSQEQWFQTPGSVTIKEVHFFARSNTQRQFDIRRNLNIYNTVLLSWKHHEEDDSLMEVTLRDLNCAVVATKQDVQLDNKRDICFLIYRDSGAFCSLSPSCVEDPSRLLRRASTKFDFAPKEIAMSGVIDDLKQIWSTYSQSWMIKCSSTVKEKSIIHAGQDCRHISNTETVHDVDPSVPIKLHMAKFFDPPASLDSLRVDKTRFHICHTSVVESSSSRPHELQYSRVIEADIADSQDGPVWKFIEKDSSLILFQWQNQAELCSDHQFMFAYGNFRLEHAESFANLQTKLKASADLDTTDQKEMWEAFRTMDSSGTGALTAAELQEGWHQVFGQRLSDEAIRQIMLEADRNADGVLSKDEFDDYMRLHRS
eukprot:GILK01003217.1.p1 GENE.GILK01003217.1~~GILK01003217.1.p1  ORF type:complete len:371 (-),score=41.78 GILK01003217.1:68-1180(-)